MTTARSADLTLRDRLSRLGFVQACKLLGPEGRKLIALGGRRDVALAQALLDDDRFELALPDATAAIRLDDAARSRLAWSCSECDAACEHVGAAFALILEEKLALGLAAPPRERTPIESLGEEELLSLALAEREERARTERMTLRSTEPKRLWSDYTITSAASGKTYRLALRGAERGQSFCSCPDFRKNTLGTCKHLLYALRRLRGRFPAAAFQRPYRRRRISLHLVYGTELELRLALPGRLDPAAARIARPIADRPIRDLTDLVERVARLQRLGHDVVLYPDAEEYVHQGLLQARLERLAAEIRRDPARHPLRKGLLRAELLPYQLDGIAFAVGAGRAILADDMGLGKTIQAIGTAELLAREAGISRVLVVCPASVKAQWAGEIERFSERGTRVVWGGAKERARQYEGDGFFTVCNYEQVLRDLLAIERVPWDLIVLDEAQRIKNWEAKTSEVIKGLKSPFALALSGTPLENRIDELYSVVEFVDDRRLAPAFRFYNRHRVVDERGRVLGYRNLDELRRGLAPVLLRRTRAGVLDELPPRTTDVRRIAPTQEQIDLHAAHMRTISSIVTKPFISEMDLLRLQKALLMCRMAANGTYLVDKLEPGHSSKLEELAELLDRLLSEGGRKIVLFSEWTTMLDLVERILAKLGARSVRLDGKVPQKRRKRLVDEFQRDPRCALFLATNAGATGLNLQAGNTVVNVDLPWNPAVLEQRIGRVHRMGQKQPVHVILLVTEDTIEERMLATLSAKHELFQAVLDEDSELDAVDLSSGVEELRRRLEVLIGRKPEAPVDETARAQAVHAAQALSPREKVAAAGGQLLEAAFSFLAEALPAGRGAADDALQKRVGERLKECLTRDAAGRPTLTVTLPDESALERLAASLSRLIAPPIVQDEIVPARDPSPRRPRTRRGRASSPA
jgi:superfamily II DNA or RNA helicase